MSRYFFMETRGPKGKLAWVRWAVALVIALLVGYLASMGVNILPTACTLTRLHGPYTTSFSRTENPISEDGQWTNGQKDGLDWANVQMTPGFAFGTQAGGNRSVPVKYDDSTALLAGRWGPNQTAQATVHTVNQNGKIYEEVELRLRSTLSPHNATGYEIYFKCSKDPKAYCSIVRWNGALGSFTYLNIIYGSKYGVADGDVIKATMIGNVITAYKNGVQMLQATDNTFTSGNPGIGFYIEGATGVNGDFGFRSFTATDK